MKILYVSSEYPPETGFGGIGTYTRHMAEAMAARGHSVRTLCRAADNRERTTLDSGVTVHRIAPTRIPLPSHPALYRLRALVRLLAGESLIAMTWSEAVGAAVASLLSRGEQFDVVEYPECKAEGHDIVSMVRSVTRLHTPWSMVRAYDAIHEGWIDRMIADRRERRTARRSCAVSAPSRAIAERLEQSWGLRRVAVFPNPIPLDDYPETTGSEWIFTGRVERRKGVHVLVRAYAEVCAKAAPPVLRLVGRPYGTSSDGRSYEQYIESLIAELDLRDRVFWNKGVPPAEVAALLGRARVAIFPSLWENFPYACLEAMASGLAVVASRCGGYPEMIAEGVSGLLAEPEDVGQLASVLLNLLNDPALAGRLGREARNRVRLHYDSAVVAEQAERFYADLAKPDRS